MPIDEKFIEEVKRANPIEDVISCYTTLRSAGRGFLRGHCVFHEDDKPSLAVYTESQTFYCYGCNAGTGGSDVIAFIQKQEGLNFNEAVMFLAQRAGMKYEPNAQLKPVYDALMNRARTYYRNLLSASGSTALKYVHDRGVTNETIKAFRMGFCDEVNEVENPMSQRLVFPILDLQMRVVGFAGRTLNDNDGRTKYFNDHTSKVFRKGEMLYGLPLARRAIQEQDLVYVVEGYMDTILFHQCGITNTICIMGTSFTEAQISLLRRYTDNVVLVMDGDSAGQKATVRQIHELRKHGLNVRIIALPMEMDPADLSRSVPAEQLPIWLEDHTVSADHYQVGRILDSSVAKLADIRASAMRKLVPILAEVKSPVQLDELSRWIGAALGIGYQAVLDEVVAQVAAEEEVAKKPIAEGDS